VEGEALGYECKGSADAGHQVEGRAVLFKTRRFLKGAPRASQRSPYCSKGAPTLYWTYATPILLVQRTGISLKGAPTNEV
jgi:hypothetical protein